MFILSAFEMAREMQITPKRLDYARMKEAELYESLMKIAEKKQDEMCKIGIYSTNGITSITVL